MPAARALCIGLNGVDPSVYAGWRGILAGAERDAREMAHIAESLGYPREILTTPRATCANVLKSIGDAAGALADGDFFLLTFAGHGRRIPDDGLEEEEEDGYDETWCLFDGQLLDDVIRHALSAFKPGVRVVMVSDSCHSGTVAAAPVDLRGSPATNEPRARAEAPDTPVKRSMPRSVERNVDAIHRGFYDTVRATLRSQASLVQARVLLLAACEDDQEVLDGSPNGVFTRELLKVWNGGFNGTHEELRAAIARNTPTTQVPQIMSLGPDPGLENEKAFQL